MGVNVGIESIHKRAVLSSSHYMNVKDVNKLNDVDEIEAEATENEI